MHASNVSLKPQVPSPYCDGSGLRFHSRATAGCCLQLSQGLYGLTTLWYLTVAYPFLLHATDPKLYRCQSQVAAARPMGRSGT